MVDLPRPGDVVVRGPDWTWGEQDGDVAGRGIVVGLATWASAAERNAARVMWENGAINVYRWGAADPCDPAGKPCYDL
ncbi:unnamed protein product, partial [Hapterophycus canaliculatus]